MDYRIPALHQLRPILIGLRKQAGISQASLAARLGITQQSYAKIEANPAITSFERVFTIIQMLGGELVLRDGQADAVQPPVAAGRPSGAPAALVPPNKEDW